MSKLNKNKTKPTQPGTEETLRESEEPGSKYGPKHSHILEDRGKSYHNSVKETLLQEGHSSAFLLGPSHSLGQSARRHLEQMSSVYSQCRSETAEAVSLSQPGTLCSPATTSSSILILMAVHDRSWKN